MMVWVVSGVLLAGTLLMISRPFWQRSGDGATRADFDIVVYKDQLQELDRDEARGLISAEEARSARLEIQRRLLAADQSRTQGEPSVQGGKLGWGDRAVWLMLSMALVGGSLYFYRTVGSPTLEDLPFAARDLQAERERLMAARDMSDQIVTIERHLQENPNDVQGLVMLGRATRIQGQFEASLSAFDRALSLTNRDPVILIDYVESAIAANQGRGTEEIYGWIEEAIAADPFLFKARFFKGYVQARNENYAGAIQTWMDLMIMAPPGAPWIGQVQQYIREAGQNSGFDPSVFEPSDEAKALAKRVKEREETAPQSGPSAGDIAAAQAMSEDERQEMILGMVNQLAERMAENPNDLAGWRRLLQAYRVLGMEEEAKDVEERIKALES